MRKLVIVLIALLAIFIFINAYAGVKTNRVQQNDQYQKATIGKLLKG